VGRGAVRAIVEERKKNGNYGSIFDLTKRVDLRAANKKVFEGLVLAGAFDSFQNASRAQYFANDEKGISFIERVIRFGNKFQETKNSAQTSLFGDASDVQFDEPLIPHCEPWNVMEELSKEKEMIGIYISAHPLDDFKTEIKYFCNAQVEVLKNLDKLEGRELTFAGIVTDVQHKVSKNGKPWGSFLFEDYSESYEFKLFNEDYLKFRHFLIPNTFLHLRTVLRRPWQNGEVRAQITAVQQLQDVLSKMAKKVTIQLEIGKISEDQVKQMQKVCKKHKGNQHLNITVYDPEEKLKLTMPSRTSKITISKDFLEELQQNDWSFRLN